MQINHFNFQSRRCSESCSVTPFATNPMNQSEEKRTEKSEINVLRAVCPENVMNSTFCFTPKPNICLIFVFSLAFFDTVCSHFGFGILFSGILSQHYRLAQSLNGENCQHFFSSLQVIIIHSSDTDGRAILGRFQTTSQAYYDDIEVRATVESIVEFEPKLDSFTEQLMEMKAAQSRVYLLYAR